MTEKQIRIQQAEQAAENGIFPGKYYLTVKHFDGRIISRKSYENIIDLETDYIKACNTWRQAATVIRSIEFILN